MLKIYNPSNTTEIIPFPIDDDKRFVTHKYNGYDTLQFEIESNNPLYQYIVEETKIADENNRYIVKSIDEHSNFITVKCDIDLDEWKETIIYEYRRTNIMLAQVLEEIRPTGWTISWQCTTTKRTTIEGQNSEPMKAVTPFDVLTKAADVWDVVFNYDVLNKIVTVIDPTTYTTSGQFFTDELNLKNLGFVGSSTGYATRLYAYGAKDEDGNPLTFADINDGKPYVEDYTYSNKVVCVGWTDERYTNKENLLVAAMAKLKQLSFPSRSYTCEAYDLKDTVWLYKVVTLIDRRRKTRVDHQIVEWKEYPKHLKDTITLSKSAPNIESFVSGVQSDSKEKIEEGLSGIQQIIDEAMDYATKKITGADGGNFLWVYDSQDRPIELLNLTDTMDINTAMSVWRWNNAGLGHSNNGYNGTMTMALLADGSINASAITTGILTAGLLRAGRIADLQGYNYWDLETGDFKLSANTSITDGDIEKTLKSYIADQIPEIPEGEDYQLTQQAVFNALTNNGEAKGIYMQSGELYINATYLAAGIISDVVGNNSWNLTTGVFKSKNGVFEDISASGTFITGSRDNDEEPYLYLADGELTGGFGSNNSGFISFSRVGHLDGDGNTYYSYPMQIISQDGFYISAGTVHAPGRIDILASEICIDSGYEGGVGETTTITVDGYELEFVCGFLVGVR